MVDSKSSIISELDVVVVACNVLDELIVFFPIVVDREEEGEGDVGLNERLADEELVVSILILDVFFIQSKESEREKRETNFNGLFVYQNKL